MISYLAIRDNPIRRTFLVTLLTPRNPTPITSHRPLLPTSRTSHLQTFYANPLTTLHANTLLTTLTKINRRSTLSTNHLITRIAPSMFLKTTILTEKTIFAMQPFITRATIT